jgi:hypothetical protein
MIKANELRIYNYVYDYYWCNTKRKYCSDIIKLKKIANTCVVCCKDDAERKEEQKNRLVYRYDDIKPIPLTEELLLKCCGFEDVSERECDYKYEKEGVCITDCFELLWYEQTPLKYLHQIQNLYFALTGEELEINL